MRAVRPESKGGTEATVKIAKADLVPAMANLLADHASFGALETDCQAWADSSYRRNRTADVVDGSDTARGRLRGGHSRPTR
jgi:hypothetical protein